MNHFTNACRLQTQDPALTSTSPAAQCGIGITSSVRNLSSRESGCMAATAASPGI